MKKLLLLILLSLSMIACDKTISFESVDDGIDTDIVKYELISYDVVKTIKNDEFYKIWIDGLEKSKNSENEKQLADSLKKLMNSKEFNGEEVITVIEFTSKINGFLYNQIGYFDQDMNLKYKIDLEPSQKLL